MKPISCLIFIAVLCFMICFFPLASYAVDENTCIACHADLNKPGKSVHPAVKMGCSACHKSVEGKNHPDQKGSVVLTQKIPALCYGCHDEAKFKGKYGHTLLGMCTGCHNPHRSDSTHLLKSDQPGVCYECHDQAKFRRKYVHKIIDMGGCSSCHAPHISNHQHLLVNAEHELCISCHAAKLKLPHVVSLPGKKRHPVTGVKDPSTVKLIKVPNPVNPKTEIEVQDPNVQGKEMTCGSCHDPHSSDFRGLLTQARICTKCHKY